MSGRSSSCARLRLESDGRGRQATTALEARLGRSRAARRQGEQGGGEKHRNSARHDELSSLLFPALEESL